MRVLSFPAAIILLVAFLQICWSRNPPGEDDARLQVRSFFISSSTKARLKNIESVVPRKSSTISRVSSSALPRPSSSSRSEVSRPRSSSSPSSARTVLLPEDEDRRTRDPVKSLGQLTTAYYMETQIGTPSRQALLLVDTGSELTWVQCSSCRKCSPTMVPPFNPDVSSSFISEPCVSSVCVQQNLGFQSACNATTNACTFQVAYLDGSEAYGVVAREIFSLESWNGATAKLGDMIFGCASKDLQNPVDFSSGTLGLNRGRCSFPAQIGARKGLSKTFSYCFPNRAEHLNSSGIIIFGESGMSSRLSYVPLEEHPAIANIVDFYYVEVVGISVDGELLRIPSSAFQIDGNSGNGGTYFDSGTTVSFLVEPAHAALVDAFSKRVSPDLKRTVGVDFRNELCYDVPESYTELPRTPAVSLHFKNNVEMRLRETSLWVPLARRDGWVTICLAFVNAGSTEQGGVNVIGNYQQQDYLIEHDLEGSRIGFAPANCVVD